MSERQVTVVLHITEERTGTYFIDESDYQEWLNGDEDTFDRVREYLKSGDEFEVIQSVYDESEKRGTVDIWSSEIEEVLS